MTSPPDPAEVRVATQALREEAEMWDEQVDVLEIVSVKVHDMELGGLEAGIFFQVVDAYNGVVHQVADRTREGVQAMRGISATLRQVALTYDNEDAAGEHSLRELY